MIKLPDNPYPGLRSFEHRERFLFFGREGRSTELLAKMQKNRFVAVVGTSGSGKSSLVRAGLLPVLHSGLNEIGARWRISVCKPGDNPIHHLAEALSQPERFDEDEADENAPPAPVTMTFEDELKLGVVETVLRQSATGLINFANGELEPDENLFLLVDQFEELFRFKEKSERLTASDEAAAFVKLLIEATSCDDNRIYVAITMRSEYLGNCSQFRGLPEAINKAQYLIPRMSRDELRRAIVSPAGVCKAQMMPGLINQMLNDIGDNEDQLPILQHALMRTWDYWLKTRQSPDEPLDLRHYEDVGGWNDALSNHANEAYALLTVEQKSLVKKLFRCLTEKDSESREKRRPTRLEKIYAVVGAETEAAKNDVNTILDVFREQGRTFLMPPKPFSLENDTVIDISHESLIRNWDKLKVWSATEARDADIYRRLANQSLNYEENRQNSDYLLRGLALEEAVEWFERFDPSIAWTSRYQIFSEADKNELTEVIRTAPAAAREKRDEIMSRRYAETRAFLEASKANENALRDREAEFERMKISQPFTRKLRWAAVALSFLFLAALTGFGWAFLQNSKLTEAYEKLNARQKEIEKQRDDLIQTGKERDDNFNEVQEKQKILERQAEELKRAERELKKLLEKEKGARSEADEQRKRADEKARLAKINEDRAKAAETKTRKANDEINAQKNEIAAQNTVLDLNQKGFIAVENSDYDDAKGKFQSYLESYTTSCGQKTKDGNCERNKMIGQWWGYHNLAVINWQLQNYLLAEENFNKALTTLGYQIVDVEEDDPLQVSSVSFLPAKYDPLTDDEEITRGIIITLRKFAKFHRDFAANPVLKDINVGNCSKHDIERKECLNKNAKILYENLINKPIKKPEIKADIDKELAEVYFDLKMYPQALKNYQSALDGYEKEPSKFALVTPTRKEVIKVWLQLNEFEEAEKEAKKVIELSEKIAGNEHLYNLQVAENYEDLGKIFGERRSELTRNFQVELEREIANATDDEAKKFLNTLRYRTDFSDENKPEIKDDETEKQRLWKKFGKISEDNKNISQKNIVYSRIAQGIKSFNLKSSDEDQIARYYDLARAYIEDGQLCHATEVVNDALKKGENLSDRNLLLYVQALAMGGAFYKRNLPNDEKAVGIYKILTQKLLNEPELKNSTKLRKSDYVELYAETGINLYSLGEYALARQLLEKVVALLDTNDTDLFEIRILIGHSLEKENKITESIDFYNTLLADIRGKMKTERENTGQRANSNISSNVVNTNRISNANSNTIARANVANANVAPVRISNNDELLFFEAYLRLRLANLRFKQGSDAEVRQFFDEQIYFSEWKNTYYGIVHLTAEIALVSKEIADNLLKKQMNAEQTAFYYLNSAEALKDYKSVFKSADLFDRKYYQSQKLTKDFYTDYIDVLNKLKNLNEPIEGFDKIEELENAKNLAAQSSENNKPIANCSESEK